FRSAYVVARAAVIAVGVAIHTAARAVERACGTGAGSVAAPLGRAAGVAASAAVGHVRGGVAAGTIGVAILCSGLAVAATAHARGACWAHVAAHAAVGGVRSQRRAERAAQHLTGGAFARSQRAGGGRTGYPDRAAHPDAAHARGAPHARGNTGTHRRRVSSGFRVRRFLTATP